MSSTTISAIEGPTTGIITRLAELPRDTILDERAMADIFGVVTRTIRRMEWRYELPPAIKLRTKRCWKAGAVIDWISAACERKEAEARRIFQRLNDC